MDPTLTGKNLEKCENIFQSGKVMEFWTDWKSRGILHKILEKSGNLIQNTGKVIEFNPKYWKSQGNSVRNVGTIFWHQQSLIQDDTKYWWYATRFDHYELRTRHKVGWVPCWKCTGSVKAKDKPNKDCFSVYRTRFSTHWSTTHNRRLYWPTRVKSELGPNTRQKSASSPS